MSIILYILNIVKHGLHVWSRHSRVGGAGPWYKWWCIARLTWSRPAAVFWNMDNSQHNTKLVCDGVGFFCGSSPKRGQVVQCVVEIYVLLARPLVLVTCHPSWPDAGHRSHQHNLDIGIASLSPSRQQCRAGATNLNIINILARPAAFMKHILADKHPLTLFYYFWYFYCNFCKLQHGMILIGFFYISETQKLRI